MDTIRDNAGYERKTEAPALTTPDGDALPRVLDRGVTMDLVQRYVETERRRSRRVFLWMSSVFLAVVLTVLALFIGVSIYMLRNARQAATIADNATTQAEVLGAQVTDVSGKVRTIEQTQRRIAQTVENREATLTLDNRTLKKDLERFGRWVTVGFEQDKDRMRADMEARLNEMQAAAANNEKELAKLRSELTAARSVAAAPAGPPEAAHAPPEWTSRTEERREDAVAGHSDDPIVAPTNETDEAEEGWSGDGLNVVGKPKGEISMVSFPNGDRYEGEFKNGMFNGWGAYWYANGDKYEGDFLDDMRNGTGVMTFRNGDKYFGDFKNDQRRGRGAYLFAGGAKYIGDFQDGKRNGHGRYIYEDGSEYVGEFKNGKKEGSGTGIYPNGKQIKGVWKEDKLVKPLE
ncbi:MAG: hypothetical protein QME60_03825 [Verrucomicrobiota bacterium]|nr:hypothetical protein [Verrucomicrobiota bacterium]